MAYRTRRATLGVRTRDVRLFARGFTPVQAGELEPTSFV